MITPLQAIANSKGWTFEALAKRWEISPRQLTRIAAAGKLRDIDAVNGLPDKSKG
jgi:DNA-binding Xre family transcriptional regulator